MQLHSFNYGPITNLPFFFKLLERLCLSQLEKYLNDCGLWQRFQSAYRRGHSTETSLLFCSDFISRLSSKKRSILLLSLDISSAFDTVQHATLLSIMKNKLNITGVVLDFFECYLKNGSVCVSIGQILSDYRSL